MRCMASRRSMGLRSLVSVFLVLTSGLAIAALGCGADGVTPTCDQNVTADGTGPDPDPDNKAIPCSPFGRCKKDTVEECCVNSKGEPYKGCTLEYCLWGYGALDQVSESCMN